MKILFLLVVALVIFWAFRLYNRLVSKRQMVREAFSGIDVQLKRRADLIPKIVDIVKGYASHEKTVLTSVTELRTQAQNTDINDVKGREQAESNLSEALSKIFVVVENYPELKASENFLALQDDLAETEDEIQMARRYYNGAVRDLNILVESFPSNLIASALQFTSEPYFELKSLSERLPPEISLSPSKS